MRHERAGLENPRHEYNAIHAAVQAPLFPRTVIAEQRADLVQKVA